MNGLPPQSPALPFAALILLSGLLIGCSGDGTTTPPPPPAPELVPQATPAPAPEATPEPTTEVVIEDTPTDLVVARPHSDALKTVVEGLSEAARSRSNPFTGQSGESGQADYALLCAGCHGAEAQGDGPASVALGGTATNLLLSVDGESLREGERFALVKAGIPGTNMQGFGAARSDAQIWKILAYVSSLR